MYVRLYYFSCTVYKWSNAPSITPTPPLTSPTCKAGYPLGLAGPRVRSDVVKTEPLWEGLDSWTPGFGSHAPTTMIPEPILLFLRLLSFLFNSRSNCLYHSSRSFFLPFSSHTRTISTDVSQFFPANIVPLHYLYFFNLKKKIDYH